MKRYASHSGLAAVLAVAAMACAPAGAAARKPDLAVTAVTAGPATVAAGGSLTLTATTADRGGSARASVTAFYLSADAKLGAGDVKLGQSATRKLRAGKKASGSLSATVPGTVAAGSYRVLGCADAGRKVKESNERNNCRATTAAVQITAATPAPGPAPGPTVPATCAPGAPDAPDLAFTDSNCDGIDGDAAAAVFVSPAGSDDAAGTRSAPKRTLGAAIAAAIAGGKHQVLAAIGTYAERVVLADGVGVYGGYGPDWARPAPGATEISNAAPADGRVEAVVASALTSSTILQRLSITAGAPTAPGMSVYGVRAAGSPGLVLEGDLVTSGPTPDAPAGTTVTGHGADGGKGGTGGPGVESSPAFGCSQGSTPAPGVPGTSPVGRPGGSGGTPGVGTGSGAPGNAALPDGGAGGLGVGYHQAAGPSNAGANGTPGAAGANGAAGAVTFADTLVVTKGGDGTAGGNGTGGGGGGGGGGGDALCDSYGSAGGGGGGGAAGGAPGLGGSSAGSSFAVYLWASSATIRSSTLIAGSGGNGGHGGGAQPGGTGGGAGSGGPYGGSGQDDGTNGAPGGKGGDGGIGGAGGGGAGGSSIALLEAGGSVPVLTGDVTTMGSPGLGGPSNGNAGPVGMAAAIHVVP